MKENERMKKRFKKYEKHLWKNWFEKKTKDKECIIFDFYRPWAEQLYVGTLYKSGNSSYLEEFLPTVYLALVKAIRDFKVDGGASFKTFASKYIQIELYTDWKPFFKEGRQRPGTFNFVGDILSEENAYLRDKHSYVDNIEGRQIIKETVARLKMSIAGWGYTRKEWKIFYYRIFKFMPVKEIQKRIKLPEWKVMIILNHIKKDILDEFGNEYKELVKGKYDL